VTVRMGRFGPFVQIGTKDDEEKPRFAGLRPGQKMDAINLADAMDLFQLPRTLGVTADGETMVANVGRFGPYVKYGSKYVSLKEDDPYTVTHERALEVIRLKQEADANRLILDFPDDGIQVLNGRYGPYITDKKKNAKIPKDREPKSLTLEECKALIAAAPERGGGRFGRFGRGKKGAAAAPAAGAAAAAEGGKGAGKKKKAANGAAKAVDSQAAAKGGDGAAAKSTAKAGKASAKGAAKAGANAAGDGAGAKPTHSTPASQGSAASTTAPRAATRATAQKAAAHDGHKAAPTAAKAKATAKQGTATGAPATGKGSSSRPRGVK
jgi:DNA topoisomerase-1